MNGRILGASLLTILILVSAPLVLGSTALFGQIGALLFVLLLVFSTLLLSTQKGDLRQLLVKVIEALEEEGERGEREIQEELWQVAQVSRSEGLLALDAYREKIETPLLRKAARAMVEGVEAAELRVILDQYAKRVTYEAARSPRVLERASTIAASVGIIGAVLGMLQVAGGLGLGSDFSDDLLSGSLLFAFSCLWFGMILSQLIFQAFSEQLKGIAEREIRQTQLVREVSLAMIQGESLKAIEEKLQVIFEEKDREKDKEKEREKEALV
jgi:chemotaxis protein MotA